MYARKRRFYCELFSLQEFILLANNSNLGIQVYVPASTTQVNDAIPIQILTRVFFNC